MDLIYFYVTVQVVGGILLPLFIIGLGQFIIESIKAVGEYYYDERRKQNYNLSNERNWYIKEVKQAPNKDYLTVIIRNKKTETLLDLGVKKSDIEDIKKLYR